MLYHNHVYPFPAQASRRAPAARGPRRGAVVVQKGIYKHVFVRCTLYFRRGGVAVPKNVSGSSTSEKEIYKHGETKETTKYATTTKNLV